MIKVGDQVLVDGWGSGFVTQVGEPHKNDPDDWVIVERTDDCRCDCGNKHRSTKRTTANLMHVSLCR